MAVFLFGPLLPRGFACHGGVPGPVTLSRPRTKSLSYYLFIALQFTFRLFTLASKSGGLVLLVPNVGIIKRARVIGPTMASFGIPSRPFIRLHFHRITMHHSRCPRWSHWLEPAGSMGNGESRQIREGWGAKQKLKFAFF